MDKMRKRFYSKPFKWMVLCVQMVCVLLVGICGSMLYSMTGNLVGGWSELAGGIAYEETSVYGDLVYQKLHGVKQAIKLSELFESNGRFDPNKEIDILEAANSDLFGKQKYKGALLKDKKYTTYTVGAIGKLAETDVSGQLRDLVAQAQYLAEEDADQRNEQQFSRAFQFLAEEGGPLERETPLSKQTLASYAKEHPGEVSLLDLYTALAQLCESYQNYSEGGHLQDMDTGNVKYFVLAGSDKVVYSSQQWSNIKEAAAELKKNDFFIHFKRQDFDFKLIEEGTRQSQWLKQLMRDRNFLSNSEEVIIAVDTAYPANDVLGQNARIYDYYQSYFIPAQITGIISLIIGIICFIMATIQTGRQEKGGTGKLIGFDRIPLEVCVFLVIPALITGAGVAVEFSYSGIGGAIIGAVILTSAAGLFMAAYLSLIRRIKAKVLWSNSICRTVIGRCRIIYRARSSSGKLLILLIPYFFLNFFLIGMMEGPGALFMIIIDGVAVFYLLKGAAGQQAVKNGLNQIAAGELDYKIDLSNLQGDNLAMAEAVNQVTAGLQLAVEKSMKDERLRTELITNVSHDIKTPLTSIINYVDLLKREQLEDEKIKGYIQVLELKAQRMKQLTEDLVEVSKISSGNVELQWGRVDMQELLNQALAEFDAKFVKRNLETVITMPDNPVIIWADGRQMWRIFENIMTNIAKYTMPGTRVYNELQVKGQKVVLTFKNISQEPLNISAEELSERFVRGDVSRTTEGSGLGLSIAKSLTEIQKGIFEIYLDGDLFKVTLSFDPVEHG